MACSFSAMASACSLMIATRFSTCASTQPALVFQRLLLLLRLLFGAVDAVQFFLRLLIFLFQALLSRLQGLGPRAGRGAKPQKHGGGQQGAPGAPDGKAE